MDLATIKLYYPIFLPAVPLILMLAGIIVGFDCIWRVEKRLDTFMKLLTAGLVFSFIRKLTETFAPEPGQWVTAGHYLDIASYLFFLLAMVEMYRIIRHLNSEKNDLGQK